VQEINTKRAKICLPPALCVAVICRQTVRKAQEIKELTLCDCRIEQNKTKSPDTRNPGSTLGEAKVKIIVVL